MLTLLSATTLSAVTTMPSPPVECLGWYSAEKTMVVLTGIMIVLTIAVVIYAGQTLKATRKSLDFFAKPLVDFKGPTTSEFSRKSEGDITTPVVILLNESALPIRIDDDSDISLSTLPKKSS